jgi:protoheme IX farnesyltransferase
MGATITPSSPWAYESRAASVLRDFVSLTKPRITLLVLITASAGIWLAPTSMQWTRIVWMLLATSAGVAAANTLNCWLERDSDRLMTRTANRPLPAGRLEPRHALVFGLGLGLVSVVLASAVNWLTGILGAVALVMYVAVYTPMKQWSPKALAIGAIPGALPPLMGWTASTGTITWPALVLFGVMFVWQLPHFIAISIFRESEYTRAGLKVLPAVRGLRNAKVQAAVFTALLIPLSLALIPLGIGGALYFASALVLGTWFFGWALYGLRPDARERWARKFFHVSLLYLTILLAVLMVDA